MSTWLYARDLPLQETARRLRALLEAIQDIVIVIGTDGRYMDVAPTRIDLLYRPPADIVGLTPFDIFPPEQARFFQQAVERTIQSRQLVTIEYALPIADQELWFEGRLSPILDEQGQVTAALLVARDITAQRRAQEALRESEEKYRTLVEQSNAAIYLLYGRRFVFVNRRFTEMFGVSYEEVGAPDFDFTDLVAPQSRPLVEERDRQVARGEPVPPRYEFVAQTKGGREMIVEVSVAYIPYRGGIATQGIVQDITDRKRAETALQESEERYRRLIEIMPEGVAVHQGGILRMANTAGIRLLGYDSPDEVLGRPIMEFVHPDDRAVVLERTRAMFERGEMVSPLEERMLRKDGSVALVEVVGAPFLLGGEPAALVVLRDIAERRRLEEQLRQAQKMEAVGRLAGGVAHDFNNLLTAINGYADLLLSGLRPEDPLYHEIEAILRAGRRAAALTQQLLAFSRKQVMELCVVDLGRVLEDLAGMLRRLISEDIELQVFADPHAGNVRIDPAQMEQVIVNLVLNARDAMPDGGRLTLELSSADLDETYAYEHAEVIPGRYVCLAVSDTGQGISPEVRRHLFEPFFTTKEKGAGLGLATAYGIVKQFEGHIQVYSELGQGTTFKVYLPQVVEEETPRPAVDVVAWPQGTETVLVVEDNEMVRSLAGRVLRRQGYTLLEAGSGEEALRLAAQHSGPIHLLLTDVVMPQMSGRDLANRLCRERPGLRVLYMSGYTDNVIAHHGVLEPGTPLIQKPFTPQALAQKVRAVLDQ